MTYKKIIALCAIIIFSHVQQMWGMENNNEQEINSNYANIPRDQNFYTTKISDGVPMYFNPNTVIGSMDNIATSFLSLSKQLEKTTHKYEELGDENKFLKERVNKINPRFAILSGAFNAFGQYFGGGVYTVIASGAINLGSVIFKDKILQIVNEKNYATENFKEAVENLSRLKGLQSTLFGGSIQNETSPEESSSDTNGLIYIFNNYIISKCSDPDQRKWMNNSLPDIIVKLNQASGHMSFVHRTNALKLTVSIKEHIENITTAVKSKTFLQAQEIARGDKKTLEKQKENIKKIEQEINEHCLKITYILKLIPMHSGINVYEKKSP